MQEFPEIKHVHSSLGYMLKNGAQVPYNEQQF